MMQTVFETFPFLVPWFATDTPVLPGLTLVRWAQTVVWGIVWAGLAARLLARQPRAVRCAAMVLAALWVLLPGAWSPAWWLGLAFQQPSHVTVLVCAGFVFIGSRQGASIGQGPLRAPSKPVLTTARALALVLGAVLLADMFILLPFSLYRWGFSSFAFGLLLAVGLLVWLAARSETSRRDAQLACAALALFALTRLPSGNVFDALIDPWLWMVLLARSLQLGYRTLKSRFSKSGF